MNKGNNFIRYLSLILVGLLFLGSGLAFGDDSSAAAPKRPLEKAREALEGKLVGLPGFAGIAHSEEGEVISVFLENEQAKGRVPDSFEGFPVHTQVTGKFEAVGSATMEAIAPAPTNQVSLTRKEVVIPLVGGISLSAYISGTSYAGTLGMVTYNNKILSNAHVIAMNPNTAKFLALGTPIIQPGSYDGGTLANRVGGLEKYIPITLQNPTKPNYADAAIASLGVEGASGWQFGETGNYQVSGTTTVLAGDSVRKSGRTTGVTTSSVYSTNASVWVYYTLSKAAYFKDQIVVYQPFIEAGDSGSSVDKGGKFVGLAFAASNSYAIVGKASYIIKGLGVSVSP